MAEKHESNYKEEQTALNEQLRKEQFHPIYLVMGEQDYLRTQNRDKIRCALLGNGDPMNAAYYTGEHFTITELVDLADTLPFLSERRVITIENSWLFKKAAGDTDGLTEYLGRLPESTHLIFVEENPNKTTRLYKAIKKRGFVIDCTKLSPDDLRRWAAAKFHEADVRIGEAVLRQFLNNTGDNMLLIKNEIDKLAAYCADKGEVSIEDVQAITSVQIKDRIFDMISAIATYDKKGALSIYMELLQLQTAPQVILALMIRNYNQLLQAGELQAGGMPQKEIMARMKVSPWVLSKILAACSGQSSASLTRALNRCLQKDLDYKRGRIDAQIAVEELIIQCAENESGI